MRFSDCLKITSIFFPGRWTRIEDPFIPKEFVLHFLAKILEETDQVISPHSVKYLSHRSLPYKAQTLKISYRVYDVNVLEVALQEQNELKLCRTAAFRHHEKDHNEGKNCQNESVCQH